MALNFLNFNEKKLEVMVFGDTTGSSPVDLGYLAQYTNSVLTMLPKFEG